MGGWSRGGPGAGETTDRFAFAFMRFSLAASPVGAVVLVAVGLVASWLLTYIIGGAQHVVPHWYYVPILFAAVRFGPAVAVGIALLSGVMAGPLTPLDVASATAQETHRWLTRTGFFVAIGLGMSALISPSLPSVVEELRRRRDGARLRRALENRELFVRAQPVIELTTGHLHGVELLVRWQHPEHGELGPDEFLPAAERSEVIHDLGSFVFAEACRLAVEWQRTAEANHRPAPRVALNMSARELESPGLIGQCRDHLSDSAVDPSLLCIEVTESALVADLDLSVARLAGLKTLGLQLAVDDFGTGYSSLSSVHRFPIDVLKIDRSFLASLARDPGTETLLGGLVLFARSLELTTIVEGVETRQQAALVTELGYELAQGYLYSQPLRTTQIEAMLSQPVSDDASQHPAAQPREQRSD